MVRSFSLQTPAGSVCFPVQLRRQVQPEAKGSRAATAEHFSPPAPEPERLHGCLSQAFVCLMELFVYVNMQRSRLKV